MTNVKDLPLKILIEIASLVLSTDFNYTDPYDDFGDNKKILEDSSKWASVEVDTLDVEFISKFIIENKPLLDKVISNEVNTTQIIPDLEIPKKNKYKIDYQVWGNAILTENYNTTWDSYNQSWAKKSLRHSYNEGEFDYWQGEYVDNETDNFENDNFEITWVESINESKKSILSRLVIENTSEVLNDLDKRTLIELRNLINRKLSSF
jgi:hypothetical protein